MTAFTALLSIKDVSPQTLCVYVSLLQAADASGAIREDIQTIRRHHNKTFGLRLKTKTVEEEIQTLVDKEIIPSDEATYRFASSGNAKGTSEDIDEMLEKLREDMSDVRPDTAEFPAQARIFAALKMAGVLEIATKEKRVRKTIDGEIMVADGEQKKQTKRVWDYGFIGKLKGNYGADSVVDTICEIHLHDGFDEFQKHDSFQKRRRNARRYLIGALKGEHDPAQDSAQPHLHY